MNAPSTSRFPTFRKAGAFIARVTAASARRTRRLFLSRASLTVYLITATLICLTYTSLRWVGRRALQAEKERVGALGMANDWKQLLTPIPTDKDNFLAAPPFAGLFVPPYTEAAQLQMWFGWQESFTLEDGKTFKKPVPKPQRDTLTEWCEVFRKSGALPAKPTGESAAEELIGDQRWHPTIQMAYAAAARPESHFPATDPSDSAINFSKDDAHITIRNFIHSLQLYARAQLQSGNLGQSLPAFRVFRHLVKAVLLEPAEFRPMSASYYLNLQKQLLLEGIALHRFPSTFLEELVQEDYPTLMQQASRRAYEVERLNRVHEMENYRTIWYPLLKEPTFQNFLWKYLTPDSSFTQMAIRHSHFQSELFVAARPLGEKEDWFSRSKSVTKPYNLNFGTIQISGGAIDQRLNFLYRHMLPISKACLRQIAIALELHYLQNQRYPKSLDELPESLPHWTLKDIDGQPFRYSTNETGSHFTLLSVGADGVLDPADARRKDDMVFSTDPEHEGN